MFLSTLRKFVILQLLLCISMVNAGQYFALCEGNFGQANASLWSINESLSTVAGPHIWNTSSNPLGDVGQSLTLFEHSLYIIMNGSHEIRVVNLESGMTQEDDIDLPDSSPRHMAVHAESGLAYVSTWNLGALLIVDLNTNTVIDTFSIGALPEQILIDQDNMYVSVPMKSDWSGHNQVIQLNLTGPDPVITNTYDVIEGPGSMAINGNDLYVTSIHYNDAWETFTGTSKIDLTTDSVTSVDHGLFANFTADIQMINNTAFRTFGSAFVPLNEDLTLNTAAGVGEISGLYSVGVHNEKVLIGSSDFVAPDIIDVFDLSGVSLGSFNVGALPSDFVYYNPDIVNVSDAPYLPEDFSLGQNYPNPFNPLTHIPVKLSRMAFTSLRIFDIQGQLVATLMDNQLPAGEYDIQWQGTNDHGVAMSSGIYLAVLEAGSHRIQSKLTLLK